LSKPQLTAVCVVVCFEPPFMATKSWWGYKFGIAVPLYWLGCRLHDLGQGSTSPAAQPPSRDAVAGAVKLTTYLRVVLRFRTSGVMPSFPHICSWHAQGQLYLYH